MRHEGNLKSRISKSSSIPQSPRLKSSLPQISSFKGPTEGLLGSESAFPAVSGVSLGTGGGGAVFGLYPVTRQHLELPACWTLFSVDSTLQQLLGVRLASLLPFLMSSSGLWFTCVF